MPALPVLLLASLALEVSGHGGMVWPPIWQDGHYTSLNKITGYKIYSDPKVKDPNTGLSIADARAWLTDQAYIGGHGDNFKTTGEQTNFKDCGSTCSSLKHPWAAPGSRPGAAEEGVAVPRGVWRDPQLRGQEQRQVGQRPGGSDPRQ